MTNQTHLFTTVLIVLALCFGGCARPVVVVQTSTTDLQLEVDAYVHVHPDIEIAYDFWSPDGVPFISLLNSTDSIILIDLARSAVTFRESRRSASLESALQQQSDFGSYAAAYPDLEFKRHDRRMHLVLEPQKWASLYGPSCHSSRGLNRGDEVTFTYVYTKQGSFKEIPHRFELAALTRISRKEITSYERNGAGPDQYFIDRQSSVDLNTTGIIVDILISILFAI